MSRYSFTAAAGPLPAEVGAAVAEACRDYEGCGSILGLSFVSERFKRLQQETEAALRRLLAIPQHFRVLFLSGGATAQFAALPFNLLAGRTAVYVESGHWSRRARDEAARHGPVTTLPREGLASFAAWGSGADAAAYCHITSNETADGTQYGEYPEVPVPLLADMTSDFLTRPIDFGRVALAYAGTQKSIGVPGLTVVILRDDLLGRAASTTPRVLDYTVQAAADSRVNTPPVFAIFVLRAMLAWIEAQGGVTAMAAIARRRSEAVYAVVDGHPAYLAVAPAALRSRINPCFRLAEAAQTADFLAAAEAAGLHDLKGHPDLGGLRVSLYNGLPEAAVAALTGFLEDYARRRCAGRA